MTAQNDHQQYARRKVRMIGNKMLQTQSSTNAPIITAPRLQRPYFSSFQNTNIPSKNKKSFFSIHLYFQWQSSWNGNGSSRQIRRNLLLFLAIAWFSIFWDFRVKP
jgi:hypothetical protein